MSEQELSVVSDVSLIEQGTYDQALRFLHHTLSAAQKAALKKVIECADRISKYEGRNEDGEEIWTELGIDGEVLIEELTGE